MVPFSGLIYIFMMFLLLECVGFASMRFAYDVHFCIVGFAGKGREHHKCEAGEQQDGWLFVEN